MVHSHSDEDENDEDDSNNGCNQRKDTKSPLSRSSTFHNTPTKSDSLNVPQYHQITQQKYISFLIGKVHGYEQVTFKKSSMYYL